MMGQDSILWVHIILQIVTFGLIFPTGMVLGVCCTRLIVTRLRLTRICTDCSIAMACPRPSLRRRCCCCRLLPGPCPWRPSIRAQHSCRLCLVPHADAPSTNRTGCIPQATLDERHTLSHPSACCHRSRRCGQNHAHRELGTDALRRHHRPWLLSR